MSRARALLAFVFFFFQAEDGIRDVAVTGVQTCALPIFDFDVSLASEHELATARRQAITRRCERAQARIIAQVFHRYGKPIKRSEEHTSELQSRLHLVCRLLLEKKNRP